MNKEMKSVIREAERRGWRVTGHNKHMKMEWITGEVVTISTSPACPHAHKNVQRDMDRIESKK